MKRWLVLLIALLVVGGVVPVVDAKPKPTKKQQRCLKAAKKRYAKAKQASAKHSKATRKRASMKRAKAKLKQARKRCLRHKTTASPGTPGGPAGAAPSAPGTPAPSTPGPTPDDPGGPTLPDDPSGGGRSIQVQSGEFYLRLSRASVLAGDVRVEFDNSRAEDPHDLKLAKGTDLHSFDEQPSGGVTAKTLHLSKGTWQLFCALQDHAARGMSAELKVTAG